jgi:hypothetical protein
MGDGNPTVRHEDAKNTIRIAGKTLFLSVPCPGNECRLISGDSGSGGSVSRFDATSTLLKLPARV